MTYKSFDQQRKNGEHVGLVAQAVDIKMANDILIITQTKYGSWAAHCRLENLQLPWP